MAVMRKMEFGRKIDRYYHYIKDTQQAPEEVRMPVYKYDQKGKLVRSYENRDIQ